MGREEGESQQIRTYSFYLFRSHVLIVVLALARAAVKPGGTEQ